MSSARERASMNGEDILAKRANYGFEKRQREIRKKKKKQEKAERKREAAESSEDAGEEPREGGPLGPSRTDRD